jgi:hypothetical protein
MKTKVYINFKNFNDDWLCATGELPAIVPFLTDQQQEKYLNREDTPDSRKPILKLLLAEAKQHIKLTSIEDCDLVLLPFKYGHSDATPYIEEAKSAGKKIMVIFNDDSSEELPLGDDCIILRTSFYKYTKKKNEYAMPPFCADFFQSNTSQFKSENPVVSFCGGLTHPTRVEGLRLLHESDLIESNFIIRNGFWAPGVSKDIAIKEFNSNIRNSLYGFCCRGAGNFSFRFGEVLSHGRIPILVDTDCVLPYEHIVDWNEHALIIPESDINNIVDRVIEFDSELSASDIMAMQIKNRNVWKEYFTPLGFVKHLKDFIQ